MDRGDDAAAAAAVVPRINPPIFGRNTNLTFWRRRRRRCQVVSAILPLPAVLQGNVPIPAIRCSDLFLGLI